MAELETAYRDATLRIVTTRNIMVCVWSNAPGIEQMRAVRRAAGPFARRHPRGAGMLNVIASGTPSFSDEVRQETVEQMKEKDLFRLGAAHVILVDGFTGTAVRAFMGTMILIGRPPIPTKVFGDMESAATWFAIQLRLGAEPVTAEEIVALARQVMAL